MTGIASRTMQAMTPRPIQAERVLALMESAMYRNALRESVLLMERLVPVEL